MDTEKIVRVNGVDLCFETFGAPDDPAILLIAGLSMSMDHWPDEFCERLATAGRFVIRYDLRDNGRSVTYPPGAPEYTGSDLDRDALGLLDRRPDAAPITERTTFEHTTSPSGRPITVLRA